MAGQLRSGIRNKKGIIYALGMILIVVLNLVAWNSKAFCDAYIQYVFPVWVNTYGRFMNLFPFSVGEILLFLAVGLTVVFIPVGIAYTIFKGFDLRKKKEPDSKNAADKHSLIKVVCKGYMVFFSWLLLAVGFIMTLNCTILYHASTFSEKYFGASKTEYTLEDLVTVRNLVAEKCNALAEQMTRDEQGRIIYEGDIRKDAVAAMKQMGESYDQLDGYYPYPKPLATSDFFSQQYMAGYYFPFSMEANYNSVMYIMNKHATMCHELAHLRGYIFEDEANFISYLACIQSENAVMEYSGYLSVLNYLDNDFFKSIGRDREIYAVQPAIRPQVHADNVFLLQEEWDRIEDKAVLDTETVDQVSDAFTETTLKVNGVKDGMLSYSRVVSLLLQYYESLGVI